MGEMLDVGISAIFEVGIDWLVRATAWFTAASLMVMLLRPLLHKLSASSAYLSWLLLPLMLPLMLLVFQLPQVPAIMLPAAARTAASGVHAAVAVLPQQTNVAPWALVIWLLGALLCALATMLQQRRYATGLTPDDAGTHLRASDARGPALLGVWRPKIVLPHNFEQRFDVQEQSLIRAHEAIHRARQDNAWNVLAAAVLCLQWFNPVAHLAWRRMRDDQELSCDAAVLRARPDCVAAYARALLKAQGADLPNKLACQWQSPHPLTQRISMLKNHTPSTSATFAGRTILVAGALVAAGAAYAAQALLAATGEAAQFYKLAMQIQLDGKDWQKPTLIVQAGRRAKLSMSGASESWDIEVTTLALPDNKLDLNAVISLGLPWQVIARPRLITREGENAQVVLTTEDGAHTLRFDVVGTLMSKADMNAVMAPSQR